jgi:glucose/arabinose dehydrogenase
MKSLLLSCLVLATTIAALASEPKPAVGLKLIAEGFTSPSNLLPLDDGSGRLLIADQTGTIHVLNKDGKLSDRLFADLRDRMIKIREGFDERGLLGVALHPKFKDNRKLYIFYTVPVRKSAPAGFDCTSRISEFKVKADDYAQLDPSSERVLLEFDKPQDNHNSGRITFGPDGFLYIGTGDGGGANDNAAGHTVGLGNGQDTTKLLGKILRIDVDNGSPYGIPKDNPFANGEKGRPEIYAYGMRNPWGLCFDRGGKHELFAADVGQGRFEEVDIIVKGGNYGWRLREGSHGFDPDKALTEPEDSAKVGGFGELLLDPIVEYKNVTGFRDAPQPRGMSVTGGYVYRGKALPQLEGRYVFGDWSSNWATGDGRLFVATRPTAPGEAKWTLEVLETPGGKVPAFIVAFGQDADGELYMLTNNSSQLVGKTGKVFKLVPL